MCFTGEDVLAHSTLKHVAVGSSPLKFYSQDQGGVHASEFSARSCDNADSTVASNLRDPANRNQAVLHYKLLRHLASHVQLLGRGDASARVAQASADRNLTKHRAA